MIAFLTQYIYGLGHSNRIKLIAEETAKYTDVLIINQLFKPPLDFTVPEVSFLENTKPPKGVSLSGYVQNENVINFRISKFIETLDKYDIKLLVSEGFPFCRHQYSHELFKCFDECKKRGIKIVISIRDFPWDDPHEEQLKDWVNYTQNIVTRYYAQRILVHGDPNILPLYSDRTNKANTKELIEQIDDLIYYTGYVCDNSLKKHKRKNNHIYVSTGLNKNEGLLLFKEITKIAHKFPDYKFIMPIANRYTDLKSKAKGNMIFVDYIPNLAKKLESCAGIITYGGYNTTVEILKTNVPAIIIPRQDGQKVEQFVRAYVFEPYNYFKVLNNQEFSKLEDTIKLMLNTKPNEFEFELNGREKSAREIISIYKS